MLDWSIKTHRFAAQFVRRARRDSNSRSSVPSFPIGRAFAANIGDSEQMIPVSAGQNCRVVSFRDCRRRMGVEVMSLAATVGAERCPVEFKLQLGDSWPRRAGSCASTA